MLTFLEYLNESKKLVCEGGASGHLGHVFEQPNLTFKQIKDIFSKVFSGKLQLTEKTDGQNLAITCIDGKVKAARNKSTLKEPMDIDAVAKKFDGRGAIKDAFVNSMTDLQKALESLSEEEQNSIFNNGKNFMALEIIYPPTKNVVDYGNRCLLQFHGVSIYDDKWERVSEDKDAAKRLYDMLQQHDALKQKTFEITGPAVLRLKDTKSGEDSLKDVLKRLAEVQGDLPDTTTINKYAKARYIKYIKNRAKEVGLKLKDKSKFVDALSDRLSNVSKKAVSKAELADIAKKEKLDPKADDVKAFINELESTIQEVNQVVIKPLEDVVIYAGLRLMKNLVGYISADPKATAKKMADEVGQAIDELSSRETSLDPSKLARFKKNLAKLDTFQRQTSPAEGVVFIYKGKILKMTSTFGAVNQLSGIFKFG